MASVFAIFILAVAILHLELALAQNVTSAKANITGRAASHNDICKEALTYNLECPGVGSYPVAGACDHFAVCTETEVTPIVEFCPDGQIYEGNKCIKSKSLHGNVCPQKSCPTKQFPIYVPTTAKPAHTTNRNLFFTTSRNPLLNLHPSIENSSDSTGRSGETFHLILLMTISIVAVLVIDV